MREYAIFLYQKCCSEKSPNTRSMEESRVAACILGWIYNREGNTGAVKDEGSIVEQFPFLTRTTRMAQQQLQEQWRCYDNFLSASLGQNKQPTTTYLFGDNIWHVFRHRPNNTTLT
jgi:hypothetical protein